MDKITEHEFHWNPRRLSSTEKTVSHAVQILGTLSAEQIEAVRLFGRSRYEEGFDEGSSDYFPEY